MPKLPAHEATLTADEGYEMDLIGNLSVFNPALVLQTFNLSLLSGELRFVIPGNTASFYFKDGHLIYASADKKKKKIGQFLIEHEWITREQLNLALQIFHKEAGRKRIGQILAEHGFLDHADLVSAVHELGRWSSRFSFGRRGISSTTTRSIQSQRISLLTKGLIT
ncbi:MAG: DUF4388 domain-containing protein [Deltaproteobacteria bacterium]|nr:DUF4388 domain-containing protein [Deltaproteobacteria bacterium]